MYKHTSRFCRFGMMSCGQTKVRPNQYKLSAEQPRRRAESWHTAHGTRHTPLRSRLRTNVASGVCTVYATQHVGDEPNSRSSGWCRGVQAGPAGQSVGVHVLHRYGHTQTAVSRPPALLFLL